jgi:hypothetical protein
VGPAVAVGAFLLVWLALWTVGGIAAIGELLRLLWGEDRMMVASGRLTVTWSRGPFRSSRAFERDAIRRISVLPPSDRLALELRTDRVDLSRLGTRSERVEAAAALRRELSLPETALPAGQSLPNRWELIFTPEGDRALVPNLAVRRTQARVIAVLAMGAGLVTFLIARRIVHDPILMVPAFIAFAATSALAWAAIWWARGRREWRIGHGRLTLRKRYGSNVRDVFEARRLFLDETRDSDGDLWTELYALGDAQDPIKRDKHGWRSGRPKNSRTIDRRMNEATEMQDLAAWLARETDLALEDRTTPAAQAADLAQLRAMLENSGRFGRWAAKVVDRLEERKTGSG